MNIKIINIIKNRLKIKKKITEFKDYNKYSENPKKIDKAFYSDDFSNFQLVYYEYYEFNKDDIISRINLWSNKNFGLKVNYEIINNCKPTDYLKDITKKYLPSEKIVNTTHLLTLFPKEKSITILIDHYYCDGIILFDLFKNLFSIEKKLNIPKYKYTFLLSDLLATKDLFFSAINAIKYPSFIQQKIYNKNWVISNKKTKIFTEILYKNDGINLNRYSVIAIPILRIFNSINKDIKYLRALITTAFDNNTKKGNNRIGVIPFVINKPKNFYNNTEKTNIEYIQKELIKNIKKNISKSYSFYHAMLNYGTLNSLLGTNGANYNDIVITTFNTKEKGANIIKKGMGSFAGFCKFYLNIMGLETRTHITYSTSIDFDEKKFLSNANTDKILEFN